MRRRALAYQLKAEQVKRVTDEKIKATEARAKLTLAEARQTADQAEKDELELKIIEEEGGYHNSLEAVDERTRPMLRRDQPSVRSNAGIERPVPLSMSARAREEQSDQRA